MIGHNQVPDPNHPGQFGGFSHHTDPGRTWNWPLYMAYLRMYAGDTYQEIVDSTTPSRITHKNGNWQYKLDLPETQSLRRVHALAVRRAAEGGHRRDVDHRAATAPSRSTRRATASRGWNRLVSYACAAATRASSSSRRLRRPRTRSGWWR